MSSADGRRSPDLCNVMILTEHEWDRNAPALKPNYTSVLPWLVERPQGFWLPTVGIPVVAPIRPPSQKASFNSASGEPSCFHLMDSSQTTHTFSQTYSTVNVCRQRVQGDAGIPPELERVNCFMYTTKRSCRTASRSGSNRISAIYKEELASIIVQRVCILFP